VKRTSPYDCAGALKFYKFRVPRRIDWHQCQLFLAVASRRKSCQLAVWRNGDRAIVRTLGESFRLPSVQRRTGKPCGGSIEVINPLPIGRADWVMIALAVSDSSEVSPAGVHSPDAVIRRLAAGQHREDNVAALRACGRLYCRALLLRRGQRRLVSSVVKQAQSALLIFENHLAVRCPGKPEDAGAGSELPRLALFRSDGGVTKRS
jgi:hypothetical protein